MRVKATKKGYYDLASNGLAIEINPGVEFDIPDDAPLGLWMVPICDKAKACSIEQGHALATVGFKKPQLVELEGAYRKACEKTLAAKHEEASVKKLLDDEIARAKVEQAKTEEATKKSVQKVPKPPGA